mmetsp:Transcript_23541/g.57669  ORF Transcript_23541/g.57669 Transcript_23541/m.57669 type:complete len:426 (+) Transcript_23541:254-1531(+)
MKAQGGGVAVLHTTATADDPTASVRDLNTLLGANAVRVAALMDALVALGETSVGLQSLEQYDDIWALRFVLSNADDAEALKAAKDTLEWRRDKREMLDAAAAGTKLERFAPIERFVAADYHGYTNSGQPMYIIRAGISNPAAMVEGIPNDVVVDFMMYRKEIGFLKCDALTRSTRVLTKLVTVNDLSHVSIISGADKRFQAVLGESSKLSEVLYPQLLDRAVLINVPYIFGALWSLFKNVISVKARAKVAICPGNTLTGDISKCPFAKLIDLDTLPSFLAGRCRCKGGCICATPNEQTQLVAKQDDDGMTLASVPARDKVEVFVGVDPGDRVVWQLEVDSQSKGVEVFVTLREDGLNSARPLTLLPKFKHKAADGRREDVITAPGKGTMVFTFDNTYSYLNSKKLRYRTQVVEASTWAEGEDDDR